MTEIDSVTNFGGKKIVEIETKNISDAEYQSTNGKLRNLKKKDTKNQDLGIRKQMIRNGVSIKKACP